MYRIIAPGKKQGDIKLTTTTLEPANINDAEALKALSVEAFTTDYDQYGSYPPGIESLAWHQSEIKKGHYYKILLNGDLVGGICVIPSDGDRIEIKYFFISGEYQDRRIGSTTLGLIEKQYSNAAEWVLSTPHKSFRNHHFYEKNGYTKIGESQPIPNNPFRLFEYRKIIEKTE
ncbi:GNAT family N-acetyltransferase [Desulfoluna butyratoxydans]|uniref:Acyl-coa n-acyltransferase n=1 Tax=Desulfoluna butyratoxydans TaxID=231438 RepID=A0A4U8YNT3_9BACT|nr:GNAT family N-acetyltransferase [Desulfoluna butyratoxydans]VFQ45294.1 acyl-coa n-acyltransferase [Desulfoluna butyratoxydans]